MYKNEIEYQIIFDSTTTPGITYICKADPGRATSSPFWQIRAISNNSKSFPLVNGIPNVNFNQIANNRASLTYSFN